MSELIVQNSQLPSTMEDLNRFILIGREKLKAVRAEIKAIEYVDLAKDVWEQKLREAQDIASAVLDAEAKVGELTSAIPTSGGGDRKSQNFKILSGENFDPEKDEEMLNILDRAEAAKPTPKKERLKQIGLEKNNVYRFEKMAAHPEAIEQAKAEARENGTIPTRERVLQIIKGGEKPHVANNSGNNEWYTPAEYIALAREVMGTINLDPASNDIANEVVQADTYYTESNSGLEHEWFGNIWLNPPYANELITKFAQKLMDEFEHFDAAIVLVNNATETEWFNLLISECTAICFPNSRVKFYAPDGKIAQPLQGQALLYFGNNPKKFIDVFRTKGWCAYPA